MPSCKRCQIALTHTSAIVSEEGGVYCEPCYEKHGAHPPGKLPSGAYFGAAGFFLLVSFVSASGWAFTGSSLFVGLPLLAALMSAFVLWKLWERSL